MTPTIALLLLSIVLIIGEKNYFIFLKFLYFQV